MTWEEKDATDWCTKTLEWCLLDAPASSYFSELSSTACVASVKGVLDVKGDASVAIAGGRGCIDKNLRKIISSKIKFEVWKLWRRAC